MLTSVLKPQDLVVALALSVSFGSDWTFAGVAARTGISTSEVHAAVNRLEAAGLLLGRTVHRPSLLEFLEHGVRYAFYAQRGPHTRGVPTGVGAPPLRDRFQTADIPVWPSGHGTARGYALAPLYRTVAHVSHRDAELYEALALVDAVRDGGARERLAAMDELRQRLGGASREVTHG
jgi:DNA-binding Lrp family transcriptional regulator